MLCAVQWFDQVRKKKHLMHTFTVTKNYLKKL